LSLRVTSFFKERPALLLHQILFRLSGRPNPRHLWDEDKDFSRLVRTISGHTLVDKERCFIIYQLIQQAASLQGAVAEVGVFKGGTARLLAEGLKAQHKDLYLFDTFEGMPPTDPRWDTHQKGDFKDTSLEAVKSFLSGFNKVHFFKGIFPESAKPIEELKFSLVHIDVDIFSSVVDSCGFFYPRMEKGGMIIFDDYGRLSCPGVKVAVDEFFSGKPEKPCYLPTGQCLIFRL